MCFFLLLLASSLISGVAWSSEGPPEAGNLVRLGKKSCQTFPIESKKFVTAKHCLANLIPNDFRIDHMGKVLAVTGIKKSENHDVAELEIETEVFEPFERADYRIDADSYIASSSGVQKVDILEIPMNSKTLFVHSGTATFQGSSGSPILQNGKVIGVHVGVAQIENHKVGVFLPLSQLEDSFTIRGIENQAVPVALAAVWAACVSSPQAATICVAIGAGAGAILSKGVDVIIEYLNTLPKDEAAELQGALKQCEMHREQITKELKETYKSSSNQGSGVIIEQGQPDSHSPTLPSEIGAVDPDLIDLLSVPGDISYIRAVQIGGRWLYYLPQSVSTISAEFISLARVAFLHKFMSEAGRLPTFEEARRGGKVLMTGASMDSVYHTAITPPPPPKPPRPQGACVVQGCPIER